jgi:hypothetical protein
MQIIPINMIVIVSLLVRASSLILYCIPVSESDLFIVC